MGRHQPPTHRSFYLSLAASTLRLVIIVALVIGGIVVINQAFPAPGSSQAAGTAAIEDGPAVTASPTPSASPAGNEPTPSPTVVGTRIAVFNGAGVAGLAADTQAALVDEYGYIAAQEPADAPAPVAVTTIYFRAKKDKVEAEFLADDFFKKQNVEIIRLEQGVGDIDRSVQLAIYLGNDYAALTA